MADYISHKLLGVIKKHQRPKDFTAPEFHDLHHSLADFLKMGLQRLLSQIQDPLATGKMWAQPPSSTIWLSGPVLVCAPAKKAIDQLIRKSHWPGSKSSSSPSGSSTPHCTPWPYTTKSGTLVACQSSRCWRTRPRSCHLQTRNSGTEPWSIRQEETCSQTGAHKHMPSAAHVDDWDLPRCSFMGIQATEPWSAWSLCPRIQAADPCGWPLPAGPHGDVQEGSQGWAVPVTLWAPGGAMQLSHLPHLPPDPGSDEPHTRHLPVQHLLQRLVRTEQLMWRCSVWPRARRISGQSPLIKQARSCKHRKDDRC